MKDDLVARLRAPCIPDSAVGDLVTEAAAEIERLRGEWKTEHNNAIEAAHIAAEENRALRERLERGRDIVALIDEEFLVRNTENDADPHWAMEMLPKMQRLAVAVEALRALDEGEKQ